MAKGIRTVAIAATPYARLEASSKPTLSIGAPGTWKTGQVVTCNPGRWTGANVTLSYQWKRDGVDIPGETGPTHTLVVADETHKVSCVVKATPANTTYIARTSTTAQSPTVTP